MIREIRCDTCTHVGFMFFFFNDTATTEIYTLSLHDALPIFIKSVTKECGRVFVTCFQIHTRGAYPKLTIQKIFCIRSEEHTSELQSRQYLVCRLLLEKKNKLSCLPITTIIAL